MPSKTVRTPELGTSFSFSRLPDPILAIASDTTIATTETTLLIVVFFLRRVREPSG